MNFNDLTRIQKEFGNGGVIHSLKYSFLNKITFYKELQGMIVTMDTLNKKYLEGNPKYIHKFLSPEEVKKYSEDTETQLSQKFLDRALPNGDRCFAILDGDFLASYGWYSTKPTPINSELELHFDPSWVYMYKGYTHPKYRGQRLHAIGMAKALETVTNEGYRGLISYVETNNFASLRSVYRMGYVNIGKVRIVKILKQYHISADENCKAYQFTVQLINQNDHSFNIPAYR